MAQDLFYPISVLWEMTRQSIAKVLTANAVEVPEKISDAINIVSSAIESLYEIEQSNSIDYRGARRGVLDRIKTNVKFISGDFPNRDMLSLYQFKNPLFNPSDETYSSHPHLNSEQGLSHIAQIARFETADEKYWWGQGLLDIEDDEGVSNYSHHINQLFNTIRLSIDYFTNNGDDRSAQYLADKIVDLNFLVSDLNEAEQFRRDDGKILETIIKRVGILDGDLSVRSIPVLIKIDPSRLDVQALTKEPEISTVLKEIERIAVSELLRRGHVEGEDKSTSGIGNQAQNTNGKMLEALEANSPVIASIVNQKISAVNGPENGKTSKVDKIELEELRQSLTSLVEYLLDDLSHEGTNLSPAIRHEVIRYEKALNADNLIWYVLEDSVRGLEFWWQKYKDESWPNSSAIHLQSLIERSQQIKPLLKREPTVIIPEIIVSDTIFTSNMINPALSTLNYLNTEADALAGLTDDASDFLFDSVNELYNVDHSDSNSERKKRTFLVVAGFLWSAIKKAGDVGKATDGIAKLMPYLLKAWDKISQLLHLK